MILFKKVVGKGAFCKLFAGFGADNRPKYRNGISDPDGFGTPNNYALGDV